MKPPPPTPDWDVEAPRTSFDALAVSPAGNLFVAGELLGATDFGGGAVTPKPNEIAFLAKYGKDGKLAWAKTFSGTAVYQQYALAVDASRSCTSTVLGSTNGRADTDTVILNGAGTFLYAMPQNGVSAFSGTGAGDRAIGVAWAGTDLTYSVFYTGGSGDMISRVAYQGTGGGSWDHYAFDARAFAIAPGEAPSAYLSGAFATGEGLLKLTGDGLEWQQAVERGTPDDVLLWHPATIAADAKGVVLVGDFSGSIKLAGKSLTTGTPPSKDKTDIFVARFDRKGILSGLVKLGGADRDSAHGVAIAPDGRVVVAGESGGNGYLTTITL